LLTSYETVIDSYAWIEYFKGSASGRRAQEFIEKGSAATSAITLAELQEKYLREKWNSFDADSKFITTKTALIQIDRSVALLAGKINFQKKKEMRDWGMADSIILATANLASAKVVTGDSHFKNVPGAEII
jgi:predicted nucleic acid-binding protein